MSSAPNTIHINQNAHLFEKDINHLLRLFRFKVELNSNNFTFYRDLVKRELKSIYINNNQKYIPDSVVIAIFNIYDNNNILNSDYGSTYNEFLETAYSFNKLMVKYNIKVPLYYSSHNYSVIDNIAVLTDFLNTKTNFDTLIISLGSFNHATCLVLTKIEIEGKYFTKVIHVNTGLGLKSSKIKYGDKNFYNLFENAIYLTQDLNNAFILFLKPFFFFKNFKKGEGDSAYAYATCVMSEYCEQLLDLYISDEDKQIINIFYNQEFYDINDYYMHMYTKIYEDSDYTFKYLNDIFNLNNFLGRLNKIASIDKADYIKKIYTIIGTYEANININSNIFYQDFITKKTLVSNIDKKQQNYLNKALNNIDLHFDNLLYITSQSAGTCVFKSLLVSIFYYLIKAKPESITDIYLEFSLKCYKELVLCFANLDYIKKSLFNEYINTSKICMQLIKDNIIDKEFSPNNMIINNYNNLCVDGDEARAINTKSISYITSNKSSNISIKTLKVSTIPIIDLNEILNGIREMTIEKQKIVDLIDDYLENTKYDDISRTFGELILISFVWELYFNHYKWETRMNNFNYHYTNLMYLNILLDTKSRIDFTTNEINWICKLISYFTFNSIESEVQEYEILQYILNYEKLKTLNKTTEDYNTNKLIEVMNLFENFDYFKFNTLSDNFLIYNDQNDRVENNLSDNKAVPNIQHYIVLYLDYLFAKNENQFDTYFSPSYSLDFDISNINRFFINYFKNDNDYYIELEYVFKILYESNTTSELYFSNVTKYYEDVSNIKNIYIYNSLIHIYNLYYAYLEQEHKYNFLKQIFINFKSVLKFPIIHMMKPLLNGVLYSLNTMFEDVYLDIINTDNADNEDDIDDIPYMNYTDINGINNIRSYKKNIYNINGSDKTTYEINDYQFSIFLYENIY